MSAPASLLIDEMRRASSPLSGCSATCGSTRLARSDADHAVVAPIEREEAEISLSALDALFTISGGHPYFVQAYGRATWDAAVREEISDEDMRLAEPEAETEIAVGFFGSRYERATPAEREYLRAMAELVEGRDEPAPTRPSRSTWGAARSRCPGARQPDQEGPVVLGRTRSDHTVPHFGRYLLTQE